MYVAGILMAIINLMNYAQGIIFAGSWASVASMFETVTAKS